MGFEFQMKQAENLPRPLENSRTVWFDTNYAFAGEELVRATKLLLNVEGVQDVHIERYCVRIVRSTMFSWDDILVGVREAAHFFFLLREAVAMAGDSGTIKSLARMGPRVPLPDQTL